MGAVNRDGAFVVARGEGAYVFDTAGKRYLDATAGLWFANVGHGRGEIADAVADQLRTIAHYSNFGDLTEAPTQELAEKLASIAPVPGSKIFFTSGGSDSVETAAKLARRYWHEQGRADKKILVGRRLAYHGMHYASTALGGLTPNKEGYGVLVADTRTVEWDDAKSLLALIEEVGAEQIAAFFCEPIIGAGGVYLPPEGYLAEVRQICRDHDILFVADEVVTGFGRIGGSWFASTRFDLQPDLMTTAKGLTSGYLPMGAVFIAPTWPSPSTPVAPGSATATPTAATPVRPPRPWPTSRSSNAKVCSTRPPASNRPCTPRWRPWPITPASPKSAAVSVPWPRSNSPTPPKARPW